MNKKMLSFCLLFTLTVSMFGCSQKEDQTAKEKDDSKPVELYLVRHGKTMLNTTDRVQGWADAPLTEAGVGVAENLGKGLKGIEFEKAYSSDSGRAIETAKIVLDKSGQENLNLIQRKDLRESCFGEFEGELNHTFWDEVAKANNMTMEEFDKNFETGLLLDTAAKIDKSKTAESSEQVATRVKNEIDKIVKEVEKDGGGEVLVVSHGITLIELLNKIAPEPIEELNNGLKNASVSKVEYKDGKYTIHTVNDMSYVEKGEKEN